MPGKWGMHTFYSRDPQVSPLLPQTKMLSGSSLRELLDRFGSVYVKPNLEHTGKGIIKVWKSSEGYKFVKIKGRSQTFHTRQELSKQVLFITKGKTHIVQQTIPLAKINGRSYDIRVMMMRDANDQWKYSGMLAKYPVLPAS